MTAFIVGTGTALPERVVTNKDLSDLLESDPEQILRSTGIKERRWADDETTTSVLATTAASVALDDCGLRSKQIDYIIFGTMTPDRFIPGTGTAVQKQLSLDPVPSLDIRAGCCNFLYALQIARALVDAGVATTILICLSEIQSRWLRLSPDASGISVLFGDGASALVVSGSKQPGKCLKIVDTALYSDGSFIDDLGIRSPGTETPRIPLIEKNADFFPRMNGTTVIRHAVRNMTNACLQLLERNHKNVEDIRWVVPHQANANLLTQLGEALHLQHTTRMISVLEKLGNTSSASMGIALDTLRRTEQLETGDLCLMPAFGTGFLWGAALCVAE